VEGHISRDMGLTWDDFFRTLPHALGHRRYQIRGGEIYIEHQGGRIQIVLQPTAERRLGRLVLPTTRVDFLFRDLAEDERSRFMDRLQRYFQRGGG